YAIVTGPNECTTTTNTVSYVGLVETTNGFVEVYPNPMTESTFVKLPAGNFEIELFNSIGQRMDSWSNGQNSLVVHRDQLSTGSYLLKMTNNNGVSYTAVLNVK
ncbi:MAG: T9SS type A sorting domain-containing protein, partial [Flavobacteriales bacterium]